jgi:hypothetical protein
MSSRHARAYASVASVSHIHKHNQGLSTDAPTDAARTQRTQPQRQPIEVWPLLVWAYRDQRVDVVIEHGVGLFEAEQLADGVEVRRTTATAEVERIARLGMRVDGGGMRVGAAADCHPDAELVHRAVQGLDTRVHGLPVSALVIQHARSAEPPEDWSAVVPRAEAIRDHKGRPFVLDGVCQVDWQPTLLAIESRRYETLVFHQALDHVAAVLAGQGRLTRWSVWRNPGAPRGVAASV